MQIMIGRGPDFRLLSGQEVMNYKFEMRFPSRNPAVTAKTMTDRSLAMIARDIVLAIGRLGLEGESEVLEMQDGTRQLSLTLESGEIVCEIVLQGPRPRRHLPRLFNAVVYID